MKQSFLLLLLLAVVSFSAEAQSARYQYSLDLTKAENDQLLVSLETPSIDQKSIRFHMPAIIPGTYRLSNYGQFVSAVKALDAKGKELPVKRLNTNSWEISKANKLAKLTYLVDDIFDTKEENTIYYMSGTNIAANENFVINPFGFFGYFEEMKEMPFQLTVTKPEGFYGSTGLIPTSTNASQDVFETSDYDRLMDSPIMYNVPDTAIIKVANADVLVSVYSPNKQINSRFLADKIKDLLQADAKYLGGKLPVDKYAFIMYFEPPATVRGDRAGALEHSYSSFYYMPEYPQAALAQTMVDIAAHEFFHVVTPLTIHSEEIENFDYNNADLSKHLWLYEGVTEYASDHVQVRYGLISPMQFLDKLMEKISNAQQNYNDTLAFTELSEKAADEHKDQYGNVYEKGALIAALLDIQLIDLSKGEMDLQKLLRKLGERFGKDKAFKDEELFAIIEEMTYPEIGNYLRTYVAGPESLPMETVFAKAGILLKKAADTEVASFGKVGIGYNADQGRLEISSTEGANEFGKAMGYQKGDLILSLQGQDLQPMQAQPIIEAYSQNTKSGDMVTVVVNRLQEDGSYKEVTLNAPAITVPKAGAYTLTFDETASMEQLMVRNQWLQANPANPADVATIDGIVAALYDVISGPAGERNWNRFNSLFYSEAAMGALGKAQNGQLAFKGSSPEEYQTNNGPFFLKNGFWEEELGREVIQFGELATVMSAYQFRIQDENSEPAQRGVNNIQLIYEQGRWWITSLVWNSERDDNPIPAGLLQKKTEASNKK